MTIDGLNDDFRDVLHELVDAGVDFVSLAGVTFEEAWASREPTTLDGRTVCFVSRDTFLKNKKAAGRPKDLADVARLDRSSGFKKE